MQNVVLKIILNKQVNHDTYLMKLSGDLSSIKNSGEFIEGIVNRFIECIKETTNEELNNVYNMHYFLPSDAVISLDIKEWIDLYNKLKFVLKQLSKYKTVSYPSCYDLFNSFEAKYAILMMRAERKKK